MTSVQMRIFPGAWQRVRSIGFHHLVFGLGSPAVATGGEETREPSRDCGMSTDDSPAAGGIEGLAVHLVETVPEFRELQPEWDLLHRAIGGTVFQSFAWNWRWWNLYRTPGWDLRIVAIRVRGTLAGIFPMFRDEIDLKIMKISRLRFLGTYEIYGEYAPLVHPGFSEEVLQGMSRFCAETLDHGTCTMISFFRFPIDSPFMAPLLAQLQKGGLRVRRWPASIIRVVMDLPRTWEEYLDSLPGNEKAMLKRRTRSLKRLGAEVECVSGALYRDTDFDDFVRLHGMAWEDEGLPGYFATYRSFERFHRTVTADLAPENVARLYFFKKDGVRFAAVHAYITNGIACFYLSGMDRRDPRRKYSPGKVLLSLVIKDSIEEGCRRFYFKGGDDEYKNRLGGMKSAFSKATVWKPGTVSLKVSLFELIQQSYHLLLEQIWEGAIRRFARKAAWRLTHAWRSE